MNSTIVFKQHKKMTDATKADKAADGGCFQAEWWQENVHRTDWLKAQGAPRTLAEMRSWLDYHQLKMLRRLPDIPVQGVVEITHVENGELTEDQVAFLGGYNTDAAVGMVRLFAAVYSRNTNIQP